MATIGNLNLKILADSASFERNMTAAQRTMDGYGKTVGKIGNIEAERSRIAESLHQKQLNNALQLAAKTGDTAKMEQIIGQEKLRMLDKEMKARALLKSRIMGVWSAVAGMATDLAKSGAQFVTWGADSVTALYRTARALGATSEGLAALEFTQKEMGQSTDDLFASLQRLNGVLSSASHGSRFAQDTFSRLGLDFKALSRLSVDQAMFKIGKAIAAIPDPVQRAAMATQIFQDKAGALLPLLSLGEAGMQRYADLAKKFGLTFSNLQGAAVEEAFAITTLRSAVEGLARQIAVNLAPWVNGLIQAFKNWQGTGTAGAGVADLVRMGFGKLGGTLAYLGDVWRAGTIAVKFFELSLYGVGYAVVGLTSLFNDLAYSTLPDFIKRIDAATGNILKSGVAFGNKWAENIGEGFDKANRELKQLLSGPTNRDQWAKFLSDLAKQTDKFQKDMEKMRTGRGSVTAFARDQQQFAKASEVFQSVMTPFETFSEKMQQFNQLLRSGALSWETWGRASAKALLALEQAHGLGSSRLAGAVTRNTTAAYSATVQSELQSERNKESPQERTFRILQQALEIEKKQLEAQKRIAEALTAPVVREMILP